MKEPDYVITTSWQEIIDLLMRKRNIRGKFESKVDIKDGDFVKINMRKIK